MRKTIPISGGTISLRGIVDLTHIPKAALGSSIATALKVLPGLSLCALHGTTVESEDLAFQVGKCLGVVEDSIRIVYNFGLGGSNGKCAESFLVIDADNLKYVSLVNDMTVYAYILPLVVSQTQHRQYACP